MSCYFIFRYGLRTNLVRYTNALEERHSDRAFIILGNLNEHTHWFTLDKHTLLTLRGKVLHLCCVKNAKTFTWIAQFNINSKTHCTAVCWFFKYLPSEQLSLPWSRFGPVLAQFWPSSGPNLAWNRTWAKSAPKLAAVWAITTPGPDLVMVIMTTGVNYPVTWNHVSIDGKVKSKRPLYTGLSGNPTWLRQKLNAGLMGTRSRIGLSAAQPVNGCKVPSVRPSFPDAS